MSAIGTREVVEGFLREVRSGRDPEAAHRYMAEQVTAHQLESEHPRALPRGPVNYAAHVREFSKLFGDFDLRIDELLVDGDKAYARWTQFGHHQGDIDGHAPTGRSLAVIDSACYRVKDGKIVEYWIQADRWGLLAQLNEEKP